MSQLLPTHSSAVYDAYVIERRTCITGRGQWRPAISGEVSMVLDSTRRRRKFIGECRRFVGVTSRNGGRIGVRNGSSYGCRVNGVSNADELTAPGRDSISIDSMLARVTSMRVSYGSRRLTDATPFTQRQQQREQWSAVSRGITGFTRGSRAGDRLVITSVTT